jgi:hypothetical protein
MDERDYKIPGAVIAGIHGHRRNNGSLPWTVAWVWLGHTFPIITTTVALVQGYGKQKGA